MKTKTQTKEQTKKRIKLPTPAEVYNHLAECIRRDVAPYRHRQLDFKGRYNTELVGLYTDYQQRIESYVKIDKKYNPKFPLKEIPPINENPYMGSFELAAFCETLTKILTAKPKLKKVQKKYEDANKAYQRILEIAEENSAISRLDCPALIYEYGVQNLDIDKYKMPKNFQTWTSYLNGYIRETKTINSQFESM